MCGLVVTVSVAGEVEQVRGDEDHALSRGYTCPKGRALGAFHHSPRRLDDPLVGRGAARRVEGWAPVLDDLAARLRAAVADGGPDAVAMYLASGSAFDAAGRRAAERFLSSLGSRSRYTATTIDTPCKPLVAELVGGWSGLTPVWDHERSRLLLLIGCNPVVSHGHSNAMPDPVVRLRDVQRSGGRVWVVDPRRTESARLADQHLQVRPGSDWLLLGWLVRRLLEDRARRAEVATRATGVDELVEAVAPITDELAVVGTGLERSVLDGLLADVVAAGRISALTGTGTSMGVHANVTEHLLWALHIVTDSYDRPGGMWFNPGFLGRLDERQWTPSDGAPEPGPPSRPELPRRFGEWPVVGLLDEIEAGNVRALLVVGGNPVTAFPDVARTRAALASLDTLVVLDVVSTETTELATHVLPAVDQLERADTTWLLDAYQLAVAGQYTDAVVPPGGRRRPVWWAFGQLAERLGLEALPRGVDVRTATEAELLAPLLRRSVDGEALMEAPSGAVHSGAVFGWVHERVLPRGGWRLAPRPLLEQLAEAVASVEAPTGTLVLVPHRRLRTMNSQMRDLWSDPSCASQRSAEVVPLHAHPAVVAAHGGDGAAVVVRSAHGSLVARLAADDRLHPEAVTLTHGVDDPNVSALTSAAYDVDPLTGMVRQSGLPVTLEAHRPG
jgi:anaerobic selenocysteine-containing dehydrogenase